MLCKSYTARGGKYYTMFLFCKVMVNDKQTKCNAMPQEDVYKDFQPQNTICKSSKTFGH